MITARRVALESLVEIGRGARANSVVAEALNRAPLDRRDRALVTELVYGTCRMQRACDWLTGRHVKGRLDPEVTAALRLGAYQLAWTRVPSHAAVSATVGEVRGRGRTVVNAVLRRVATDLDNGVTWPDLATELSYPDWIIDRLRTDLGPADALEALRQMDQPGVSSVRADGYVQDRASQMVCEYLAPLCAGGRILDVCAAPGGKATGLAALGAVSVVASDLSVRRAAVMAEQASHLAVSNMSVAVADGLRPPYRAGSFEMVLVDAPCSGLGVLGRRPDARWRGQPGDLSRLASLQLRLLLAAKELVRPGGTLAYSVCTLTAAETTRVAAALDLQTLPPPGPPWRPAGPGALLLPQDAGTDGMYLMAMQVR